MVDDSKPQETTGPNKELNVDDILLRVDSLPILDPRRADEILGYDEHGVPTGTEHAKWPDFEARAKRLLGDRVFDDSLMVVTACAKRSFVMARD